VDVDGDTMHYRWRLAPAAPGGGDPGPGGAPHYGVLLAKAVGMPAPVLSAARAVAEMLEAERAARVAAAEAGGGGGGGGGRALREVYSLVHRLGCVARQAGAGVAPGAGGSNSGDVSGAATAAASGGGDNSGAAAGSGRGAAAGEAAGVEIDPAALEAVLPLLRELKAEAERLCFGGGG
jgi:hypothetical protein